MLLDLDNDQEVYFNGEGYTGGTGFLVNKRKEKNILAYKSYTHRISKLIWQLNKEQGGGRIQLLQVYAPTTNAEDSEIEEFYSLLQLALDEDRCKYSLIMGDLNAKIGKNVDFDCMGKYGYGERNDRGVRLLEFVESNSMFIMNTFVEKAEEKKWTWVSPDGQTKNEIDFIIASRKSLVSDVEAQNKINTGSDHRALKCILNVGKTTKRNAKRKKDSIRVYNNIIQDEFESILAKEISSVSEEFELESCKECLINGIKKASNKFSKEITEKEKSKIPPEIQKLLQKRRKLKREGRDKVEFSEISKLIRKELKKKKWSYNKKINELKETIEKGGSLRKYWKTQAIGREKIVAMKDKEGRLRKEKYAIADIITDYYEELYKYESSNAQDSIQKLRNEEEVPKIITQEVEWAIKTMKQGKAGGKDGVVAEELKAGGETLVQALTHLFNLCLNNTKVPKDWLQAQLILLFKKGDKFNMENYRPISLLSATYKVFMKIIQRRIENKLDQDIPIGQTGFRKNLSTLDNIFVLKQLIRRALEYDFPLVLIFIDFRKAFDSVYTHNIIEAFEDSGIENEYLKLISYVYKGASLEIQVENDKRRVKVDRGIRQGDVLSGKVFIKVLEEACNKLEWEGMGIKVDGRWLNILKFADDIVIIAKGTNEAQIMINDLTEEARKIGLQINRNKTKIITVNLKESNTNINLDNEIIEKVRKIIYLGVLITDGSEEKDEEISRRVVLGWKAYNKYKHLFRSEVSQEYKKNLWSMCVLPVMTYGSETWTLTEKKIKRLRVAQRNMERSMLKLTRRDRKRNDWIRKQTGLDDIGKVVLTRKWNWGGHVARSKDERWTKILVDWYPRGMSRKRGRPGQRWDEEMRRTCGGVTWQRVAWDRKEWIRMRQVYCDVWLTKD